MRNRAGNTVEMMFAPILFLMIAIAVFASLPRRTYDKSVESAELASGPAASLAVGDTLAFSEQGAFLHHAVRQIYRNDEGGVTLVRRVRWLRRLGWLLATVVLTGLLIWAAPQGPVPNLFLSLGMFAAMGAVMIQLAVMLGAVGGAHQIVVDESGVQVRTRKAFFFTHRREIPRETVRGVDHDRVVRIIFESGDDELMAARIAVAGVDERERVVRVIRGALLGAE